MNIKHILLTVWVGALAPLCLPARAGFITVTGSATPGAGIPGNGVIPDDDLNGLASTIDLTAPLSEITSVSLTLDLVGNPQANDAYNGDYYAYLQFSTGLIVLFDNIGPSPFGSPGSGIDVTLSDGNPNISSAPYAVGLPLTGTYSPQAGGASTGSSLASTFGGLNPNGAWTLFIADESPGGVGELASWSLDVTAKTPSASVPDQGSTLALLLLGIAPLAAGLSRARAASPRLISD